MSSNFALLYDNQFDSATLTSFGSWRAAWPIANVQDREITAVARSTDATTSSTKLKVEFSSAVTIQAILEVNHNFTQSAQRKISAGTTSGASDVYAGSFENVWHMSFSNTGIKWMGPRSWWGSTLDSSVYGAPFCGMKVFASEVTARYWTIEYSDTGNSDGFIQIGRLLGGQIFQPAYNPSFGLQDGWVDKSGVLDLQAGGINAYPGRAARSVEFALEWLTASEASRVHDMQRRLRTINEVGYIPYPSDMAASQQYGFVGRLAELPPMVYPYVSTRSQAFKIVENL